MWSRISFSFRKFSSSTSTKMSPFGIDAWDVNQVFKINSRLFAQDCQNVEVSDETFAGASEKPYFKTLPASLQRSEGSRQTHRKKVLKVALIGRPNAGKSTLINQIVGRTICPVSMKTHTTRIKLRAFANDADTQLVFLDTPGLVFAEEVKKFKFEPTFLRSAEEAVSEADIIGVLHDASCSMYNTLGACIIRLLLLYQEKKSFLVINKVDATKKHCLLKLTESLTKKTKLAIGSGQLTEQEMSKHVERIKSWPYFNEVFMVSALEGDGVGDVKEYLLQEAHPGPWLVDENKVAIRDTLAVDFVKAACLDYLEGEVPYKLQYKLLYFEDDGDQCSVEVVVIPATRRHGKMVLDRIRPIAAYAEANLASAMEKKCLLRVRVQVLENKF